MKNCCLHGLLLALLCLGACSQAQSKLPPDGDLRFPSALTLSQKQCGAGACYLFVVNSNFDLAFRYGSLHTYDVERVVSTLRACEQPGDACTIDDSASYIVPGGEVFIRSYAAGLKMSSNGQRLYTALQSAGKLLYVNVNDDGSLVCDATEAMSGCNDDFMRGSESVINGRDLKMPRDPVGLHVGSLSNDFAFATPGIEYIVTAHRLGELSLFVDNLFVDNLADSTAGPHLVDVLDGFDVRLTNLRFDRAQKRFYLPNASTNLIDQATLRTDDSGADPQLSFMVNAGALSVRGLDDGRDMRDVLMDPVLGASRAYLLSRRPEAVVIADLASAEEAENRALQILNVVKIGQGPSRMMLVQVGAEKRVFVLASCYDSRDLYLIDTSIGDVRAVLRGFSGPFELSYDEGRQLLFVADFRASVIRVVDMQPLENNLAPVFLGTLGTPQGISELQ